MSQVLDVGQLSRHFHRIQDHGSGEQIPIAFFDEFDSPFDQTEVGWLKYFLMPLQDGVYTESSDTFDVSRAIFLNA
jgi:hypothetical protein